MDGKERRHQRIIKKLYKEALECAKAEGAIGSELHRIAQDYIEVLKINNISVVPAWSD